tara:strand:+ start:236 stop:391 length:156 start_codon:yes stop_codon:yes gene_type:complete
MNKETPIEEQGFQSFNPFDKGSMMESTECVFKKCCKKYKKKGRHCKKCPKI